MAWALSVAKPNGTIDGTFTSGYEPSVIDGTVEAVVEGGGRTRSITFRAAQTSLPSVLDPIEPRSIIRYSHGLANENTYTPVAVGVVVSSPPLTSPGSGPGDSDGEALDRFTAVGLEQLYAERIVGPYLVEEPTDVAEIAYSLCNLYGHPVVNVNPANFQTTLHELGLWFKPEATLAECLDELCAMVPAGNGGAKWWIDHDGSGTLAEVHLAPRVLVGVG